MTRHIPLSRHSPLRHPDWRWHEAQPLACAEKLDPRLFAGDAAILAAAVYVLLRAQCDTDDSRARIKELFAEIDQARTLYETPDCPLRWEIEARVLAKQDDRTIGLTCGVDPAVVATYERLFFAARDRLGCTSWIVHCAVGNVTPVNVGAVWRLYGYFGGRFVLDAMLEHYRATGCTDYQYLLQPRRRDEHQPELHATIERALLARFAPLEDCREALRIIAFGLVPEPQTATTIQPSTFELAGMLAELLRADAEQRVRDAGWKPERSFTAC